MHLMEKTSLSAVWYTLKAAARTIHEMQDKNSAISETEIILGCSGQTPK